MLSEDLRALVTRLSEYRHSGLELSHQAVSSLVSVLEAAAEDAAALEDASVPRKTALGLVVLKGGKS
ncbi:MAG: hypothetical protein GC184_14765 [Rhizobiales bacterium]|nr:hypothetical protein [Hyphomicrobiales bacterium]